jgi:N-acetylmuramoyl-L-alanine amidase
MNAFSAPTVHGFEIFYLSAEGGEQTINEKIKELEEEENSFPENGDGAKKTIPNGNGVLNRILFDLQRNATTNSSSLFAQALSAEMSKVGKLRNRGVQRAAFRVLKTVNTPSVLIEMGFITSPRDEDYYLSEEGRSEMSVRIADGIERFLRENNVKPKGPQDILVDVPRSYVYPKEADRIEVYVVQPGDTLGRIARRFNVSQKSIMTENPEISRPDLIVAGKALRIKVYSE